MKNLKLYVSSETAGARIDKWLSDNIDDLSRSSIQRMLKENNILINSQSVSKNYKLQTNDVIDINIPEPKELDVIPQNIPVDIVYEDDDLLVVNKPKGMVVHPAAGNPDGTLVNALLYHCKGRLSSINGVIRPGIVHRIDKYTSGLLIVAKTDKAHTNLAKQIKEHSFKREYVGIVCGRMSDENGTVNAPIGRHKLNRKKMCVTDKNSKKAITHYEVLETFDKYSLLKFRLETGRTHQIRVHMSYIGHPILGDDVYGKSFKGIDGQCLHAKKIGFVHPTTEEYMEFDSELPEYFDNILKKVR